MASMGENHHEHECSDCVICLRSEIERLTALRTADQRDLSNAYDAGFKFGMKSANEAHKLARMREANR